MRRLLIFVMAWACLALAACGTGTLNLPPATSASSARSGPPWVQDLTFSGDLSGHMTGIVANGTGSGEQSECTGNRTRGSGTWSATIRGEIGDGVVYSVLVVISPYRGPGTYNQPAVSVQVHNPDSSKTWQNFGDNPVTFTMDRGEEGGTLDAQLSDASSGKQTLHLAGSWSCIT